MRKTFYCCIDLDERSEAFLQKSMEEFSHLLSLSPVQVDYKFKALSADLKEEVVSVIESEKNIVSCSRAISKHFYDKFGDLANLVVLCPPGSALYAIALQNNPLALWGINSDGLAAIYNLDNKYIVWHETLHILGAKDCYDLVKDNRGPNCELGNCIMQYEATEENVGPWPFLCKKNVSLVKSRINKWQNPTRSG